MVLRLLRGESLEAPVIYRLDAAGHGGLELGLKARHGEPGEVLDIGELVEIELLRAGPGRG